MIAVPPDDAMNESPPPPAESKSPPDNAQVRDSFHAGEILAGKYKVVSCLGTGGMGKVYRVLQVFLKKEFALKTLENSSLSATSMRRFQLEAKAASSLSHPNLVQVHDFGVLEDGQPYLVMDLIEGNSLAEYLKSHGPMTIQEVVPIFAQACFGLMAAHESGIVHRDIKPGNIMLSRSSPLGAEGSVKVVDFGIAKLVGGEEGEMQALTRTGEVFGSPLYMSPEQCSGGLIDHRSDIYSLGCVLFEALAGTPPHMGANALSTMRLHQSGPAPTLKEGSMGKKFPEAMERIVAKMLAKLPGERYENLGLVAHDLASVAKGFHIGDTAPKKSSVKRQGKTVSMTTGQLTLALVGTMIATGIMIGIGGYFVMQSQTRPTSPEATKEKAAARENAPGVANTSQAAEDGNMLEYAATGDFRTKAIMDARGAAAQDKPGECRKLVFPQTSIGKIWSDSVKCAAKGTVRVAQREAIQLRIDGAGLVPEGFEKIDPQAIFLLSLNGSGKAYQQVKFRQSEPEKLARILKIASGWANLRALELTSLKTDESVFNEINHLNKLSDLVANDLECNQDVLCHEPFLDRLRKITITNMAANKILQRIAGSPALNALSLCHAHPSAEAVLGVQKCPYLMRLLIEQDRFDDRLVEACAQIKSLQTIALGGSALSDEQIDTIRKCPGLSTINLSKTAYSRERIASLTKRDKRIHFWDQIIAGD